MNIREAVVEIHAGQVRRWSGEPYHLHCWRVADMVAAAGLGPRHHEANRGLAVKPEEVVAAALLHDALEDQPLRYSRIMGELPEATRLLVGEMTHQFTATGWRMLSRSQRKALEADRIRCTSFLARAIKLYDVLDNMRGLRGIPEARAFARMYADEKSWYFHALPDLDGKDELGDHIKWAQGL